MLSILQVASRLRHWEGGRRQHLLALLGVRRDLESAANAGRVAAAPHSLVVKHRPGATAATFVEREPKEQNMQNMQDRSPAVRRHAIFKQQYRRVVAAAGDFHSMTPAAQWALLRAQLVAEEATGDSLLLDVLDSREARRDEVLARLEEGRQQDAAALARRQR